MPSAKTKNKQPLWDQLADADLLQGTPPEIGESDSPWYIKLLLALSGWIAALFLFAFIATGFADILENRLAAFITGGLLIAIAFALLRLPKNEFLQHLMLAVSLTGQALMVFAIYADTTQDKLVYVWGMITIMQLLLALMMPDFVHRVWSAFATAIALSITLKFLDLPAIESAVILFLSCWLVLNEFHYPTQIRKFQALSYGFILALIALKSVALFTYHPINWITGTSATTPYPWLDELLLAAVMLYLVFNLIQRHQKPLFTIFTLTTVLATLLLCALSMQAQGITVAMAIMILGFSASNSILLSLGIVSLLFYSSSYYYQLHASLLDKSQTLLILGCVLLILRYLLLRFRADKKETPHAS
ncbi:MAG: putative membrane protein [Psychromonas sp.]|jgi:uncharacterized membrane protein|uniref:DUF4401 domain-containing protein n=1 Tax=Psychromonas sp. TaxID=1884585 RepID=UPI0039E4780D